MSKYLIKIKGNDLWLDGFDGQLFEWTELKNKAWRLSQDQAGKKIKQLSDNFDVELQEVSK